MRVTVRYMAQLRAAAGVASETVDIAADATAAELAEQLAARHGEALGRLLLTADGRLGPGILVFVGDAQAGSEGPLSLKEGDVVTLLSPVAGG